MPETLRKNHWAAAFMIAVIIFASCERNSSDDLVKIKIFKEVPNPVTDLVRGADGKIWIVSAESFLYLANSNEILELYYSPIGGISSISARSDSSIVIGGQDGIGIFKNENWTIINSQNSELISNSIKRILCAGDTIYAEHDNSFSIIKGSVIENILKDDQAFPNIRISDMELNSKNELVFGTENSGIIIYHNGSWNVYDSVKNISDIFIDEYDNIWFTYPAIAGIGRLSDQQYNFFYPPGNVPGDPYMWSITSDPDGFIWCGSTSTGWNGALFKFDISKNEWSSVQADNNDALDAFVISEITTDYKKNIWFYRGYGNLCIYNEKGIR